jgi:hypothetical protein
MTTYLLVLGLLQKYPELRNSDKKLQWACMSTLGLTTSNNQFISRSAFYLAPSMESVRLARQLVQANPKYRDLRSNKQIQKEKNYKQHFKGTFPYHEKVQMSLGEKYE